MSLRNALASRILRSSRKIESLTADVATLRADVTAWKLKADGWKRQAGQKSRRVLSTHMLQDIFDLRERTLSARTAIPPREQREAILREVSAAYVAAVEQGPAVWGDHVHPMRVRGLRWWMPVVRPQPGGVAAAWIAKQRFPYRALTQTRELAVGGIMLDIGANTGRMSIPRVVLGDVVAAYCAEPDPLNYACLVGNVVDNNMNGLLLPDRIAIADRDGIAVLRRADVSGGHRVMAGRSVSEAQSGSPSPSSQSEELLEVPCLTLDTWLARLRVDPDAVTFVKVDVQGYEMRVLEGASALLAKRHVAWQMELGPALLSAAGASLADVCAKVQQYFTHFIDLNGDIMGPRRQEIDKLPQSLAYMAESRSQTDVLFYCASR